MSGNVREWCWDYLNQPYPNISQTDPKGPTSPDEEPSRPGTHNSGNLRVARGGYFGGAFCECMVACRMRLLAEELGATVGFRSCRN